MGVVRKIEHRSFLEKQPESPFLSEKPTERETENGSRAS